MIFRRMYARRIERAFRPYMHDEGWANFQREHLDTMTEWQALKLLMPLQLYWFRTSEEIEGAYRQIASMTRKALGEHEREEQCGDVADRSER